MNKYLVLVYVPVLEKEFDIFIPINKKIGVVSKVIIDTIFELLDIDDRLNNFKLYDRVTGIGYDENELVVESSIQNGSRLILL